MGPRPIQYLAIAILTVATLARQPATAQESSQAEPVSQPPAAAEAPKQGELPPVAADKKSAAKPATATPSVPRLVGPDGTSVVLPKEATLKEFLTWLQQRNGPDYAVNSVALEGTADDKRAELTATITVQLLRDGQWVRIPIFLNEGQLSATKHTFLGSSLEPPAETGNGGKPAARTNSDAAAAYSDVTQEAGYRWWFRGKGFHRLKISLVVPVTKTVAQRRLRLKLPPLAAASTVSLRVDDPNLIVVSPKDTPVTRAGKSASQFRIVGVGSELDLQWRTVANDRGRAPMLQAQTAIVVDFTDDSVELTALQRVQVLNGSVGKVEVQLPAGYQAEATGKFVDNYQIDARNRATVVFSEPRSEWTEINWTLRRRFPAGGILTLDGFHVDSARVQSGELAIVKVQGLRVETDENNAAVSRIRTAGFSAPSLIRDKSLSSVHRFASQPFRLPLRVSRVQPQLVIDPTVRLDVSDGKMVLNATFAVEVSDEGGTVRDLEIHWPGWRTAGWRIQPLAAMPLIERRTLNAKSDAAPIRLRLAGRRGGKFEIPLSAERTIAPSKDGVEIRLPVLTAAASRQTTARPTTLVVARDPNLTLDLTDREEQPLPEIPPDPGNDDKLSRRYRIADAAARLTARIKSHPQRLRATAAVNLDPKPFGLFARQKITLQVEYVSVRAVRFEVPEIAAGRIEFFDADRNPLATQPVMSKMGKSLLEVRLDQPRLGKLEFTAVVIKELAKPLAPGESTTLSLPLVGVEGVEFSRVRVQAPANSKMELTLPAGNWRRVPTVDSSPAWSRDAAATSFDVRLTSPDVPRSHPFTIQRALVRASIDSAGAVKYRAQYRVAGDPDAVVVDLPPRARLDAVYWGSLRVSGLKRIDASLDGALATHPSRVASDGRGPIRIPVPTDDGRSGSRLLTLDYHASADSSSRWMTSHDLVAPRFPENVWIEENAWQVILPRDRHLSSFGAAYMPEFFWSRTSVVWTRHPTAEFADPEGWIDGDGGPSWTAAVDGNSYVFRRYGPAENLAVQSMSRSLIVLAGAGLAWLLGILLVKLPRLRTLAVLLTAALGAAVAGLWFATELQLLLQPALLGAALAVGIVGIDRLARRRTAPAVMAVAHPSDFVTGSRSNVTLQPRPGATPGSEDPTSVRPPALNPEPSSTASEARRQG
jgi:hypothetical protein